MADSTGVNKGTPETMPIIADAISVAGRKGHSVTLKKDGSGWAWGWNEHSQIGLGFDNYKLNKNVPHQVLNISNVAKVSGGYGYSIALKRDGTIYSWGKNDWRELAI